MSALTGFNRIAVIKMPNMMGGTKNYCFALYDDHYTYSPGDKVLVTGAASGKIWEIDSILPYDSLKTITQEVITKVDTSAYDTRMADRRKAQEIKKALDKMVRQMDQHSKYQMYAEKNPEFAELLSEYEKLAK